MTSTTNKSKTPAKAVKKVTKKKAAEKVSELMQKKKRTHVVEEEAPGEAPPKSFVAEFSSKKLDYFAKQLVLDVRMIMTPNTAAKLKVRFGLVSHACDCCCACAPVPVSAVVRLPVCLPVLVTVD